MSSSGVIYSQPIIPSLNADEGPCYLTIDLSVKHASIEVQSNYITIRRRKRRARDGRGREGEKKRGEWEGEEG